MGVGGVVRGRDALRVGSRGAVVEIDLRKISNGGVSKWEGLIRGRCGCLFPCGVGFLSTADLNSPVIKKTKKPILK